MAKPFSVARKITLGLLVLASVAAAARAATFPDVPVDHPNAAAIDYLSKESILAGYPDGTFQPERVVNRAEALKILLLTSDITVQTTPQNEFPDVPNEAWFAPFVASARARAIAAGYPDGLFRPEQTVNLVEALKMLLAAAETPFQNYATDTQLFADTDARAWYNPFLAYASKFTLVEPNAENKIFPASPLTRGALAEIVYRFATRTETVCPRLLENVKTISPNYFRDITLVGETPNVFYENEVFAIAGSATGEADSATAFFTDSAGEQHSFTGVLTDGTFTIPVEFTTPGLYNFSIIPGTSGRSYAASIEVLPRECAPAVVEASGNPPQNPFAEIEANEPVLRWESGENNLVRVVLRQGEERFERLVSAGQNFLTLNPTDFAGWQEGAATLQIFGAKSEHGWSFEPRTQWLGSPILSLTLAPHHFSEWRKNKLALTELPIFRLPALTLSAVAHTDLEAEAYLITPTGAVAELPILENAEKVPSGTAFQLNLPLPEVGAYILEINEVGGVAVLNHPLYLPDTFPLLPDFADLREAPNPQQKLSLNRERAIWLRLVNEFRAQNRLPAVRLDTELTDFSQKYAERMATENFFGHTDPAGNDPEARRQLAGLQLPVGENLARDFTTADAHAGLLRSAAHRSNILLPEWTRVGLGVAEDAEGRVLFVQEFSTDPLTSENLAARKAELHALFNAARREQGVPELLLDLNLDPAVQDWSEKMVAENFIGFTDNSASLENSVRAAGYSGSFASFVASAGQLEKLAGSLSGETAWLDADKSRVSIGLAQGSDGRYRATFVFR